jgi:REase_DpnII-MboI/Uncharacterized protein conserved in bacteria (DUF2321)
MSIVVDLAQDVMQVCRNGHVITMELRSNPDTGLLRCDRCGAGTIERCPTCGHDLPGAVVVPGMQPIGAHQAPRYCAACGAAFPWTNRPRPAVAGPLVHLEPLLRRLPLVIRQLRIRQGDRPPFLIGDERDLEDLVRALLPLHFDDVRPHSRTPRYDTGTRTDFLLAPQRIALTVKLARPGCRMPRLVEQFKEDAVYYQGQGNCRMLVGFVYDPEGVLGEGQLVETACSGLEGELEMRCVVGTA